MKILLYLSWICIMFLVGASDLKGQGGGYGDESFPNFVIIFLDDLGYADIEPFGSTTARTPALNKVAKEGIRCTSFYSAPTCSPSRAELVTGLYAHNAGMPKVIGPASPNGLSPDSVTIAEILKSRGYSTACIGKWHLGDFPRFLPTNQGFDYYYGIPYSNDMGPPFFPERKITPLMRNDKVVRLLPDIASQTNLTQDYTAESIRFIQEHRDKPFFLYLAHTAVHVPLVPSEAYVGRSGNGLLNDWVEEVDNSTGRIIETIKNLGLSENTIVVFTSDNGPWLEKGNDAGSAGPFRGGKGSTFEGGVRVPTIVWAPGRIPPNTETDVVLGLIDIMPTFAAQAGIEPSSRLEVDGVNAWDVLTGLKDGLNRDFYEFYRWGRLEAIRHGDWKLEITPRSEGMGALLPLPNSDGQSSYHMRLFNLKIDPNESKDLSGFYPEIYKKLIELIQ